MPGSGAFERATPRFSPTSDWDFLRHRLGLHKGHRASARCTARTSKPTNAKIIPKYIKNGVSDRSTRLAPQTPCTARYCRPRAAASVCAAALQSTRRARQGSTRRLASVSQLSEYAHSVTRSRDSAAGRLAYNQARFGAVPPLPWGRCRCTHCAHILGDSAPPWRAGVATQAGVATPRTVLHLSLLLFLLQTTHSVRYLVRVLILLPLLLLLELLLRLRLRVLLKGLN